MTYEQGFSLVRTVAEAVLAVCALVGVHHYWPIVRIFRRRVKLLADLESKSQRNRTLEAALQNAKDGNDGLMIALRGISEEVGALADQLADLRLKLQIGVSYICELIAHHESHRGGAIPPIPAELRHEVAEGLKNLPPV